ncbi:MAG: KamA family radical SAM protein [Planctomycetota bacterium]
MNQPEQSRGSTAPGGDWRRQMAASVTSLDQLAERLPGFAVTDAVRRTADRYPFRVTPHYLSLVREPSCDDPIFRQCGPDPAELDPGGVAADELHELSDYSPVPGLIHRYRDRVVVLATSTCPVYCRHCTRKRLVGRPQFQVSPTELDGHVRYVREHPEIKDVILSGGDPLTLANERLEDLVARFRSVPSVEIIRVGTRAPVVLPARIDAELCHVLERHHPVWLNTQFNHPREVTPAAAAACDRLIRHGIPVNNQSVLLRGVNDRPAVMEKLCRALLRIRVRPYYLFQCDPVAGVGHFRTPVARGTAIMRHLFRSVGGLGVPRFAVDAVAGGGKVPIGPNYVLGHHGGRLVLRNLDGETVTYPDAGDYSAESGEPPRGPRPGAPPPE